MSKTFVDIAEFVESGKDDLVAVAAASVDRARLTHYEAAGFEVTEARLGALVDVLIAACRDHRLDDAVAYAEGLATSRHTGGFPLLEVQTAINVLEEAIWRSVLADVPAESQGHCLALVSTVLGAIKDAVARGYLTHIGSSTSALRVESLFSGSEGTAQPL